MDRDHRLDNWLCGSPLCTEFSELFSMFSDTVSLRSLATHNGNWNISFRQTFWPKENVCWAQPSNRPFTDVSRLTRRHKTHILATDYCVDHMFEEGTLTSEKQDLLVAAFAGSPPIREQRWSSRMVLEMVYFSFVVSYRLGPTSFSHAHCRFSGTLFVRL